MKKKKNQVAAHRRLQRKVQHHGSRWLSRLADSPLPELLLLNTLILQRYWHNSDFSYPSEIWLPVMAFAVVVTPIFYLYRRILGKGLGAHLAAMITSYCLYSFSFVEAGRWAKYVLKILPNNSSEVAKSLLLVAVFAVLAGVIGWAANYLLKRYQSLRSLQPYKVLVFAVTFVFAYQVVKDINRWWTIHRELSYHYPAPNLPKPAKTAATSTPDIYYLLFDRYGNADALKNNFNYDNSGLYDNLASQGFVNRPAAMDNYPFTMSSVSSTMAMNYFPEFSAMFGKDGDWQSAFAYRSILNNPPIAQILKQNGYDYNQISSWWDFTRVGIQADSNPTQSFRLKVLGGQWYLSDLQRDIINKSILGPWLRKGLSVGSAVVAKYDLNRNPRQNFEAQFSALQTIASRGDKSTPQFSFAHILAPHDPYIFTADGSEPTYDNQRTDIGVDETVKYTNEITYINQRMEKLVANIKQNDPKAVIVIQADEGPYPKQFRYPLGPNHYYDPINLPLQQMKEKVGVLASYYMPGMDAAKIQEQVSSVDVFRVILNSYLGYNLPILPDCHLSTGDKYTLYNYQLLPAALTGQPIPAGCQKYL